MKILRLFLFSLMPILCIAGSVQAVPVLPTDSPVYFQFNNIEQVDTTLNNSIQINAINPLTNNSYYDDFGACGNWGVFNISSIQSGSVATPHEDISGGPADIFFDDGVDDTFLNIKTNQGQVHGIFFDLDLTSPTTAKNGFMDVYFTEYTDDEITQEDLNGSDGPTNAAIDKFTDGTFLARLYFDTGIIPGDDTTTLKSNTDITTQTASGQADSFASVDTSVVGAWTDILNGDWFHVYPHSTTDANGDPIVDYTKMETRDIRFSTFYNRLDPDDGAPWDDNFVNGVATITGLRSNDPGRVFTAIPEPGTMFLVGIGLLGLVGIVRRKED